MDGQILASGLMSLHGTDLRMVYALLCRTNIGHLLASKTKDLFSDEEKDHFTLHLTNEVSKLEAIDDEVLKVDLFLEITKLLKLRGTKYAVRKEIEDQCQLIIQDVYEQLLKQDKQFRAFVEASSSATKLQQMITYQMSKVFSELDQSFQDFTIEDQTKFAAQVNEYIHSLPEDKQAKIKDKLGINDLTDDMVRKAIATSGTSIVFAIIVEVSGFAFYTTATSLVAAFAGLFGLTLPFGFYTGLTSTIAVLANPLFIIPLLLGGGMLLVRHQNKALKKKLLPIIVMQIALPYMSSGGQEPSYEEFIRQWQSRYREYIQLHAEKAVLSREKAAVEAVVEEHNEQIGKLKASIRGRLAEMSSIKHSIIETLKESDVTKLSISSAFAGYVLKYISVLQTIVELREAKQNRPEATGFFEKLGSQFKKMTLSLDIYDEQKKLEPIVSNMAEEVLRATGAVFMQAEREQYRALQAEVDEWSQTTASVETVRDEQQAIAKQLNQQLRQLEQLIYEQEQANYGLADLGWDEPKLLEGAYGN